MLTHVVDDARGIRLLYIAIGAWMAAIAPFIVVSLHARGIDTATIGLLSALMAVAATILVPAWGHLADILVGRAVALRIGIAIAAASASGLLLPLPYPASIAILASFAIFPMVFLALADALAVDALPAPERQFGAIRALASLSFAVGAIIAGSIYDHAGYAAAPVVLLVGAGVLHLAVGPVPDRTNDPEVRANAAHEGSEESAGPFGSISQCLSIQPRLWAVIAVFALGYTGLLAAFTFVPIRIVDLGGLPSDVALSFAVAAFAEIPGLMLAGWIGQRIGIRWLVVLTFTISGLAIAAWGVVPTPIAINMTRVATGLCFGALFAARVLVTARLLPAGLQATGQTMLMAATFGLGSVLGAVIGGALYGTIGSMIFFVIAGGITIGGGLGAWVILGGPVGASTPTLERSSRSAGDPS